MSTPIRSAALLASALVLAWAGCGLITEPDRGLIPPVGTGGAGGEGGSITSECGTPIDCPGDDSDCSQRSCDDGACGTTLAAAGDACDEDGGAVCDGEGSCVECVGDDDCRDSSCDTVTHTCQPSQCRNGVIDGDETDVDCGGPTCRTGCAIGMQCMVYTDCASHYCSGDTCTNCSGHQDCQLPDYCSSGGSCVPKQANGAACAQGVECTSGQCVDGVCCGSACGGACQNCGLDGIEGVCGYYGAGLDPDDDCPGDDVCEGGSSQCECGNGSEVGAEQCDDGDNDSYDGCSAFCDDEAVHLIISELVMQPTGAEYIEIYNPTGTAVDLSQIYLANVTTYHLISAGAPTVAAVEMLLQFPSATTIPALGFVTVSLESATAFQSAYGALPTYDIDAADVNAPDMLGTFGAQSQLGNVNDLLVMFRWDGATDLVTDVDYLTYGNTSKSVNKTGVLVGASTYLADTPVGMQLPAPTHVNGQSLIRCDTGESTETKSGGNGTSGHNETSESATFAFRTSTPTPGAAPANGVCP